jgi:hypothetical protein
MGRPDTQATSWWNASKCVMGRGLWGKVDTPPGKVFSNLACGAISKYVFFAKVNHKPEKIRLL